MRSMCSKSVRRGLAVVDTVVLLVVLVFLMGGLLVPMLSRARAEATNDTCDWHLANIGKAMLIYAANYDGAFPRGGGRDPYWGPVVWNAPTRQLAYATTLEPNTPGGSTRGDGGTIDPNNVVAVGGNCTISSCYYLLVKYADMDPNQFVCPQDPNVSVFSLDLEDPNIGITELNQAWDFGVKPQWHCSYAYDAPWGAYAATAYDDPNRPVSADRNPYLMAPGMRPKMSFANPADPTVVFAGKTGDEADQRYGNSMVHNEDGQNVLFVDGHISFETRAYCGLEDDNIYTVSSFTDRGDPMGRIPVYVPSFGTVGLIKSKKDSILLHDPAIPPHTDVRSR